MKTKKQKPHPKHPAPEKKADWAALYLAWKNSQESEYEKVRRETLVLLRAMRGALTLQVKAMIDRVVKTHKTGNLDEILRLASSVLEACDQELRWLGKPTP
jgi:hypothetical protein